MKLKMKIVLLCILFLFLSSCTLPERDPSAKATSAYATSNAFVENLSQTQAARPTRTPPPTDDSPVKTTYVVTLYCPECEEVGQKINIWKSPNREGISGSVPHNTKATVLDTTNYNGVRYYKVRAGGVTGWVSELFINK